MTPARWWQLINLSFMVLNNSIGMFCLSPLSLQVSEFYNVTLTVVNLLPAMGMLIICIASLPTSYLIERYGSSKIILASTILNALGCALKLLINESFWFCIIGAIPTFIT